MSDKPKHPPKARYTKERPKLVQFEVYTDAHGKPHLRHEVDTKEIQRRAGHWFLNLVEEIFDLKE